MLKPFIENHEVVGVKGSYKTMQKEIIARFVQLEYEDKYNYMLKPDYIDFIDTYSAGFKKTVFIEMNGYNTEFPVACAEDIELSYRISSRGYKMVFNPNTIVYHTHPSRLLDYLKKKYKFAYWRMLAVKKNPKKLIKDSHTPQLMKLQLLFPPVIFINILLSLISEKFVFILFFMLLLFVLTVIPFAFQAIKKDLAVGLLSPFFLFLRASAQFLGIAGGIVYLLRKKNKCQTLPLFKD
jgi:GT2 family glycosyltransferase